MLKELFSSIKDDKDRASSLQMKNNISVILKWRDLSSLNLSNFDLLEKTRNKVIESTHNSTGQLTAEFPGDQREGHEGGLR